MVRVTVVMPVRNPGRFLQPAIDSVLSQTYDDWELVVVDDGSAIPFTVPDSPRIKLLRQKASGVSVARNLAIMNTESEFLAFLDGDDVWLPDKLVMQVNAMDDDPTVGMCFTDRHAIDEDDNVIDFGFDSESRTIVEISSPHKNSAVILDTMAHCLVVTSTVVLRRTTLPLSGMFDPLLRFSEDYDMWTKVARAFKVIQIESAQVLYRKHEQNTMSDYRTAPAHDLDQHSKHAEWALLTGDKETILVVDTIRRTVRDHHAIRAFDQARKAFRERRWLSFSRHFSWVAWYYPSYLLTSLQLYLKKRM